MAETENDLSAAQSAYRGAFERFKAMCEKDGFRDEWHAYKVEADGFEWSEALKLSHKECIERLHHFYALRDGPHGWLGGRERAGQ